MYHDNAMFVLFYTFDSGMIVLGQGQGQGSFIRHILNYTGYNQSEM